MLKAFGRLLFLLVLLPLALQAQTCKPESIPATTPNSRYVDQGDGTVTDKTTGLMWKRCAEGQYWDVLAATCKGNAYQMNWLVALKRSDINNQLLFAGKTDWRVPSIKELASLVEEQCIEPAINLTIFPATEPTLFWSSSPLVNAYAGHVWLIQFRDGNDIRNRKDITASVRLVRG